MAFIVKKYVPTSEKSVLKMDRVDRINQEMNGILEKPHIIMKGRLGRVSI
jgi:hypothetical protein